MEPTTRDRTTAKDWLLTFLALGLIVFGSAAIASIPDVGIAFLVAGIVAVAILAANHFIGRRTR